MVRYIMSFHIPESQWQTAERVINSYFDALQKNGPGGMRSQCYESNNGENNFVHIKSFKKEAIANHHFKSAIFREYLEKLSNISGKVLLFYKLYQQQTFESIY
ncbi:MAG: hypothetical protein KAY50_08800 [Chitinophagaceae bacterium]|nr:hypothetical protein [Chitinophagaceae bacterium]